MAFTSPTQAWPRVAVGQLQIPVAASTKIPQGVPVCINGSGYAANAADTSGLIFVGFAAVTADNTSGSNGDITVRIDPLTDNESRYFIAPCTGATQAWCGVHVFFVDNASVALTATTTNDVIAGMVVQFIDSTHVLVDGLLGFARTTS